VPILIRAARIEAKDTHAIKASLCNAHSPARFEPRRRHTTSGCPMSLIKIEQI
jgi:hypothetical protein